MVERLFAPQRAGCSFAIPRIPFFGTAEECKMNTDDRNIVSLTIPNGSPDLVFDASQELIKEVNLVAGPVASRKTEKGGAGSRGDPLTLGAIVLAAISAGVAKQIAQVLVAYINRNPKYVVQVGAVKITKEFASSKDVEAINMIAHELSRKKVKGE